MLYSAMFVYIMLWFAIARFARSLCSIEDTVLIKFENSSWCIFMWSELAVFLCFCTNHKPKEVEEVSKYIWEWILYIKGRDETSYGWVWRATWIIRDRRDSESEYCNTLWYSSRAVILLTTDTRWAWIRGCSSFHLLGSCKCACWKMISWRRMGTFPVVATLLLSRIEGLRRAHILAE
jgi:hypothetical protein